MINLSRGGVKITGNSFTVAEREAEAYRSFDLPLPSLSPEERFRRLAAFRNESKSFLANILC